MEEGNIKQQHHRGSPKSPPMKSPQAQAQAQKPLVSKESSMSVRPSTAGGVVGMGTTASALDVDLLSYGYQPPPQPSPPPPQQGLGSLNKPLQTALKHHHHHTAAAAATAATSPIRGTSTDRASASGSGPGSGSGSGSLIDRMRAPFRVSFERSTTVGVRSHTLSHGSTRRPTTPHSDAHGLTAVDEGGLDMQGLEIPPPQRKIDPWDEFFRPEYLIIDLALVVGMCNLSFIFNLPFDYNLFVFITESCHYLTYPNLTFNLNS